MLLSKALYGQQFSLLDAFFGVEPPRGAHTSWSRQGPRFDSKRDEDGVTLQAELPGLKPEELELSVEGRTLTIAGKRKLQAPEGTQALRQERTGFEFRRQFDLGDAFDPNQVEASLELGVLKVRLRKRPEAKPRQIAISVK